MSSPLDIIKYAQNKEYDDLLFITAILNGCSSEKDMLEALDVLKAKFGDLEDE